MTDSIAFGGLTYKNQRVFIPPQPPKTFAELFGVDLAHLWDSYAPPTWVDSVGGLNGGIGAFGSPAQATTNGHTYPVFVDANNDGLITANSTMLNGLSSWTIFYAFKGPNPGFFNAVITKTSQFYLEPTGSPPKAAYYNQSTGTDLLGTTRMDDDVWHRVIVTSVGDAGSLYVDGVLEATGTVETMPAANSAVYLGSAPSPFGSVNGGIAIIGAATRGLGGGELIYLDNLIKAWIGV